MTKSRRADIASPSDDTKQSVESQIAELILGSSPDALAAVRAQLESTLVHIDVRCRQSALAIGWLWSRDVLRLLREHDTLDRRARHLEAIATGDADSAYPPPRNHDEIRAELVENYVRSVGVGAVRMATDAARRQIAIDGESLVAIRGRIGFAAKHLAGAGQILGTGGLPVLPGKINSDLRDDLKRVELLEERIARLTIALEQLPDTLSDELEELIAASGGRDSVALALSIADASIHDIDPSLQLLRDDLAKLQAQWEHIKEVARAGHGASADGRIAELRATTIAPRETALAAKQREVEARSAAVAQSAKDVVDRAVRGDADAITQICDAAAKHAAFFSQGFAWSVANAVGAVLARAGSGAFADGLAPDLVTAIDPLPIGF